MAPLTLEGFIGASDTVTENFLVSVYPAIAAAIEPALTLAAVLYWALFGYKVYAGFAALEWRELAAKAVLTSAVFTSLNWGGFGSQIYHLFVEFTDSGAGTMMAGESATTMLNALLINAEHISATLRATNFYQINAIIEGSFILVLNCLLFTVAVFYMTISKLGLAVTMVLLPLFVGFSLFPETRHWFVNWLNRMLNFSLIYILVVAIVKFAFVAFGQYIDDVGQASGYPDATLITSGVVANLCVVECVLIVFMLQVSEWAKALSGSVAAQGGAAATRLMKEIRSWQ